MKALRFSEFGPPSVLAFEEVPRPEPRDGEVLVQVKAAAINPSDVKTFRVTSREQLCRALLAAISPVLSWQEQTIKAGRSGAAARVSV
jgi:NADPH:quinone reductase-like Zn-dependent oxidoreductase